MNLIKFISTVNPSKTRPLVSAAYRSLLQSAHLSSLDSSSSSSSANGNNQQRQQKQLMEQLKREMH